MSQVNSSPTVPWGSGDGFDGSWVAHPDVVPVCAAAFTAVLGERPDQLERLREDVRLYDVSALLTEDDAGAYLGGLARRTPTGGAG